MVIDVTVFLKLESGFKSGVKTSHVWDGGTEPATTRLLCGQVHVLRLHRDQEGIGVGWQLRLLKARFPFIPSTS